MLGDLTSMQLYAIRMARSSMRARFEETMAALAKYYCTVKGRNVCRLARDVLGGNGVLLDFHVMRHLCDMDGSPGHLRRTAEIQSLIVGRHITGQSRFA